LVLRRYIVGRLILQIAKGKAVKSFYLLLHTTAATAAPLESLRYRTLSGCIATALLAGCGGSQPPIGAPGVATYPGDSLPYHKTFNYTGAEQTFTVPAGLRKLTVVAVGARGGANEYSETQDSQALGGRVRAIIPVTPGEKLVVFVGGQGSQPAGGFNGGGNGAGQQGSRQFSYGGGGASDVRQDGNTLNDRILVAGGGGGEQSLNPRLGGLGGKGGGRKGEAGTAGYNSGSNSEGGGGGGGTQRRGGLGGDAGRTNSGSYDGHPGSPGSLGVGGGGGVGGGNGSNYSIGNGGGGGAGYYGGGGGGGGGREIGTAGGGGGGGSSYIEPSAYEYRTWRGWKIDTDDGLVIVSWP
jgi:Glycine rich protein